MDHCVDPSLGAIPLENPVEHCRVCDISLNQIHGTAVLFLLRRIGAGCTEHQKQVSPAFFLSPRISGRKAAQQAEQLTQELHVQSFHTPGSL
jgi:hypothetical protein